MFDYAIGPQLWMVLIFLVISVMSKIAVNVIMSKWLNVEGKSLFTNNYVNEQHKKIDIITKIIEFFIILLAIGISVSSHPTNYYWFFQPWIFILVILFVPNIIAVIMELKNASNRNAYKVTLSEIIFMFFLVLIFILFLTDSWKG